MYAMTYMHDRINVREFISLKLREEYIYPPSLSESATKRGL